MALAATFKAWQAELPPTDPVLRAALALGNGSPDSAGAYLVRSTTLLDTAARRALLTGGAAAVAASKDPLIVLARRIEPLNRALTQRQMRLESVISTNAGKIGRAMFDAYGTALPPDATFTPRISDGVVKGFPYNGTIAPYKTTFAGLYDRAWSFDNTGAFKLPQRWVDRRDRLDLSTPFNFVGTNDIIGGNSGSPGDQPQRRDRRAHLRREHRDAPQPVHLHRRGVTLGERALAGDHRGAAEDVRRGVDRERAGREEVGDTRWSEGARALARAPSSSRREQPDDRARVQQGFMRLS